MKPIHMGGLVAAGVFAGVLFMKVVEKPPAPAPTLAPVVAEQKPIPAPEPAAEAPKTPEPLPSPFPEKAAKPAARKAPRPRHQEKQVAQSQPPAQITPATQAPASQPEQTPSPAAPPAIVAPEPPAPPPPQKVTVQAGTLLPVRLVEGLSSERNKTGDTFTATLDQPLTVEGFVIAERGARLEGRIVQAEEAGRVKGLASLGIELTRLTTSDGQKVPIATDTFTKAGPSSVKEDVAKGAAATGIGAVIGAIAGGGKGAAIGAVIGAGAGTGAAVATRGKPATLPTETRLSFRLKEPVTITEKRR